MDSYLAIAKIAPPADAGGAFAVGADEKSYSGLAGWELQPQDFLKLEDFLVCAAQPHPPSPFGHSERFGRNGAIITSRFADSPRQ